MENTNLKPVERRFSGPFICLDMQKLKENLQGIIASKEEHFSDPPDTISWQLTSKHGKLSGEKGISELAAILDSCDANTAQLNLQVFKKKTTSKYGFGLMPEEYLILILDFVRKNLFFAACVVGETNSNALFEITTSGISLIGVELPPEHQYLEIFLRQFCQDHPIFEQNVFLIMRFQQQQPFPDIVQAICNECAKWNLNVLRTDDKEYTDDLWDNVMTYLYGCKSAIAVFDQINYREFNPNVALEVGFLLAQRKRVLLLKDLSITVMPTDIVGKIYRSFNTYDPQGTIPQQIEKWVTDYKIGD